MHDTVIVGGGIAGLTAALYASRKRMDYRIISSEMGGQFYASGEILNYPGVVETDGVEFQKTMEEQMRKNDVEVVRETVEKVERAGEDFNVITDKREYETKTVILATGARPRKLGVPGEEKLLKKGVTYCSICDGPLFNAMDVAVIGGGNSALEAVDFIGDIASKIYVLTNEAEFRAHEYLQEKAKDNPKVEAMFNADIKEIAGDEFVNSLKYEADGRERTIDVKGVIIEIGRTPNTENFKDLVETDNEGHIKVDCRAQTSTAGVFAAGDCTDGHEYQYVIAAGQGCMALLKAARYLAMNR
ncbi:MAG: FAD-binding protein [Candidatus Altiarchaeales archaeon]|nr:FAD-binding protein [Candidatus Altiarchaeales archaeon]MBD3416396.1 FAD-binding protein [Candidatus Altiarchaeales archaeon]